MVNQKNREVRAGLKPECELTAKRNVQNSWIVPVPSWSRTVTSSPKFAPENYASLPSRVSLHPETDLYLNEWHGSGFQLSDLPCYPNGPDSIFEKVQECGRCGSKNIVIVYLCNWYDQSGADIDLELECKSCGTFTQYKGWA